MHIRICIGDMLRQTELFSILEIGEEQRKAVWVSNEHTLHFTLLSTLLGFFLTRDIWFYIVCNSAGVISAGCANEN